VKLLQLVLDHGFVALVAAHAEYQHVEHRFADLARPPDTRQRSDSPGYRGAPKHRPLQVVHEVSLLKGWRKGKMTPTHDVPFRPSGGRRKARLTLSAASRAPGAQEQQPFEAANQSRDSDLT
jgi:hypothetical protein